MVDISNKSILETFGSFRRGLNLVFVDALKSSGLGTKQALFLRYLDKHETASQAELSRATLTDPAGVNRALASLLKKGWVDRADDPDDARRWMVRLTRDGRKVAKKVDAVFGQVADGIFSTLSHEDRNAFHGLLLALIERGFVEGIRKEISK